MATLTNTKIKDTYDGLLKTTDNEALDVSGVTLIEDGLGNASALSVGRSGNGVTVTGNLAVDTDTLYVDAANNRVGIGTSTLSAPLDVRRGDTDGIVAEFHNSTGYGIDVGSSESEGYISTGYLQDFVFKTNSGSGQEERMRIESSGNVTIKAADDSRMTVTDTGDSSSVTVRADANNSIYSNKSLNIYTENADHLAFSTNGASNEAMRIDSSGNVGIGTVPSYNLHNTGSFGFATNITGNIGVFGSNTATADTYFRLQNSAGAYDVGTSATGHYLYGQGSLPLQFFTNATERMRIDSSGNVGINTNPTAQLDVSSGATNVAAAFRSTDSGAYIGFADNTTSLDAGYPKVNLGALGNNLIFATENAERMRITSGGDVLFGTQGLPDGTTYYGSGFRADSNSRRTLRMATSFTGLQDLIEFYNPNGYIGKIQTNGSATIYATSSDYRLKENVVEMTGALDRVDALKPSRFNFIADPEKTVDGFLAHEVAQVIPEAVTGEKDAVEEYEVTPAVLDEEGNVIEEAVMGTRPVYQGIDQSKIVPLLVGAIKELSAKVAALESQLNA